MPHLIPLWLPPYWACTLSVAYNRHCLEHLAGGRITSGDLQLRMHARTHTTLLSIKHNYNRVDLILWLLYRRTSRNGPMSHICNTKCSRLQTASKNTQAFIIG